MHIGIICNEHPALCNGGGIGSFTDNLSKGLIANGHSVTIFGVYKNIKEKIVVKEKKLKIIGIPYKNIPKIHKWYNRKKLMLLIKNEHRENNLSILESPDYQGWLYNSNLDLPKIIRLHSPQKVGFDNSVDPKNLTPDLILEQKSLEYADFLCSCGTSVAEAARKTYSMNVLKKFKDIKIIYNSVDTKLFKPNKKMKLISNNIVFAGRLTEKKGVVELIKAWKSVIKKYPDLKLILAGRDSNYKSLSMKKYLKTILSPEIRETVIFKDFLKGREIISLFQDASVCIFPSHREAFSVVVLEAMSTGTAVIYSKIDPAFEIINDGVNGLLCDPRDPNDIFMCISKIIDYKDLKISLGINARRTIKNKFSNKKIINENIEYYKFCIKNYVRKNV